MNRKYLRLRRILGISTILLGLLIALIPTASYALAIQIEDNRSDKSNTDLISVDVENGKEEYTFSIMDGSTTYWKTELGAAESDLMNLYFMSIMYGTDYYPSALGAVYVTIPLPEDYDAESGEMAAYTLVDDGNGGLSAEKISYDPVTVGDVQTIIVTYKLDTMTDVALLLWQEAEEEPTATPSPSPTPTPKPTSTPTPTPTATPTPAESTEEDEDGTVLPISDEREDTSDTAGISAAVYGGSGTRILIVRDSDGVSIKRILVLRNGWRFKPWYIRLVDQDYKDVTNFRRIRIQLPIPAEMDLSRGRVRMVGIRSNGDIHSFDTDIVSSSGYDCASFETDYFSDYQYGMVYLPDSYSVYVDDRRVLKNGTKYLKAAVSEECDARVLIVKDSAGVVIRRRVYMKDGMIMKPVFLRLVDGNERDVTDFGSCTITLPLPDGMDPEKGTVEVVGSNSDNEPDYFLSEIVEEDGQYCVRFTTDYFSDYEYAILYTPDEDSVTPTPTPTSTPTPTPRAAATSTPTPTKKPTTTATPTPVRTPTVTPTGGGSGIILTTSTPTPTIGPSPTQIQTPNPIYPIPGGGSGDIGGGSYTGGTGNGANAIITLPAKASSEKGGNAAQGSVVKTQVNNAKDMPKTGSADVPRMLIVVILFVTGIIQLIATIPFRKR